MTETERAIAIIEARLPLYTDIGQINALRECILSIRSSTTPRATAAEATVTALQEKLMAAEEALEYYANPEIYKPHPHGPAFDRRDVSFCARTALTTIRRTPHE